MRVGTIDRKEGVKEEGRSSRIRVICKCCRSIEGSEWIGRGFPCICESGTKGKRKGMKKKGEVEFSPWYLQVLT